MFTINPDDKFYPSNPVHDYSIFLGKFTDSEGINYDLAIYDTGGFMDKYGIYTPGWSDATAHSDEPGDYTSGKLRKQYIADTKREWKLELYKRAIKMNLLKK